MLNRHSKKFIRYLRSTSPDFENRVYTYSYLERNHPEPIESIYATVRYLSSEGYLEIAKREPERCVVIDAQGTPEEVSARVLKEVETWV